MNSWGAAKTPLPVFGDLTSLFRLQAIELVAFVTYTLLLPSRRLTIRRAKKMTIRNGGNKCGEGGGR